MTEATADKIRGHIDGTTYALADADLNLTGVWNPENGELDAKALKAKLGKARKHLEKAEKLLAQSRGKAAA